MNQHGTSAEQALGRKDKPVKNINKALETFGKAIAPKNFMEVFDFLKESDFAKNFSAEKLKAEARKFFNHYTANGWKIGGKTPMENWKPVAENWLLKMEEFEIGKSKTKTGQEDYLHTQKSKNYHQPL
jgi:hypothetical protein